MIRFFKSDMETVKKRLKRPVIIATLLMTIIAGVVISQGNLIELLSDELLKTIHLYFVIGGVWYGRNIIARGAKAPVDLNTEEEYYPGGFNGSLFRWIFALVLGATVGAVMFLADVIRVIGLKIKQKSGQKTMVNEQ